MRHLLWLWFKWRNPTPFNQHATCTPEEHSLVCVTMTAYFPMLADNVFSSKPYIWSLRNEQE